MDALAGLRSETSQAEALEGQLPGKKPGCSLLCVTEKGSLHELVTAGG